MKLLHMADKWKKDSWIYKATLPKTEEPPKTYEEFLKFNSWDYWPRNVNFIIDNTWESNLKKIKEENTFMPIYSYLSNNVPLTFEAGRVMESRLKKCTMCLEEHASKLFEWNVMATKESKPYFSYSHEKIEKYKAFLQKYGKEKKIMLSDEMKAEKNIQGYNFPGFKTDAVTPLPRHIDAKRVYLFVLKNRVIEEKLRKIWRYHFLSEASIELLHDCFWWWFLYKFKPDRKNEDYLFDRISENYAVLFLSIPIRQKDTFLQVYPDYLAQAICAVFYEAFPESAALFNDEFKKDLGNTIHLWMTGLKPAKGFWTHWNLKDLLTTTIHGINKVPEKTLMEKIIKSQERLLTTMEFNIKQILQNPRGYKRIEVKEVQTSRPTIKSHYRSFGPEFHRILFNFGGQSPLILYYLKKHEPAGNFGTAKQNKFKLTEISKVPTAPAPTYRDTIKEAKRQFAKNRKDFRIEKQTITEQIKVLKKRQERIDKELTRLQEKATRKPFEAKAEAENFLYELHVEEEQERKLIISPSSSSESSLSIPENYDYQEEKTRRGKMTLYSFIVS